MKHRIEEQENGLLLAFSGELTIVHAAGIRDACQALVARGQDAGVDLSGTTAVDVSALQLLCSLHRTAVKKGLNVLLEEGVPGEIAEVIRTAGYFRGKACSLSITGACLWKGAGIP